MTSLSSAPSWTLTVPGLLLIFVTFGLMWLLLIRPQQRRVREHEALVAALAVGDEVVTQGGIYGFIESIDGDCAQLQIAPDVQIRIATGSVAALVDTSRADIIDRADHTDATDGVDAPSGAGQGPDPQADAHEHAEN